MIEFAQINYISNIGSNSKKGSYQYRNFINRLESKKYFEQNNIKQVTVWDKIKKIRKMQVNNNGV